ncbi:unnamed protein product [Adineta ricciae]|uniref:Uncharacterized protein n=1 Tax=Adineta ricciae TaxID=249248 RepID=A0A813SJP5_ADIRI|nr:unnamed protein product [Adineta ricciae]CAF1574053.1 unnamed protein product [Adineta ricciae]
MFQNCKKLLRFENFIYGNGPSGNSSCPSTPAKWCVNDYDGSSFCIDNPALLPTCILALLIGLYCSKRIHSLPGKFPTRYYYQLTFFLYGIMMTSAGILHCFLDDKQKLSTILRSTNGNSMDFIQLVVTVIDVGLTSNIAVSFMFCGLCDIKLLNPQSAVTSCLLFLSYLIVFLLWTLGLINQWNWIFNVLYLGIVAVCCFIFLLTQLCLKKNRRALPALFVGGLYGAIGLLATTYGAEHICTSEGPFWSQYFGPEFIWFLFSDISVAFVFIYVTRANQEKKTVIQKYPIDIETLPEKF